MPSWSHGSLRGSRHICDRITPVVNGVKPMETGFKYFAKDFGSWLIKPSFLIYIAAALTANFWIPALTYFVLQTALIKPTGLIPWTLLILTVSCFVAGLVLFFRQPSMKETRLAFRTARLCKQAGNLEGWESNLARGREAKRHAKFWIGLSLIAFLPIAPCGAAIVISGGPPMLTKVHGVVRYTTREEEIRRSLYWMHKRGIFTPMEHKTP